ncbi:oligopeptide transport system permease protein OppB [Filifactor alocis ATCC 35896]|jgi:ABC-type dipeptide/oligopeptide/nickel transport systems, permease components|uniref:Oligopeptide transport system permease protein OppB n=1 Tax=Filifactor alocis (strain ATCC 35896 / CCUG 47790 / D40 B5) TaxID=546269 RepID=D6GQ33_FILAD|nr:ABC transporter permease [Filifactor alocis]EFE28886.1 oligopeptide transport system permease protein OppB [Filifactor alocis ATCC 35896]
MGGYVVRRIVSMIITLFFVITLTFVMMHSIPGNPFTGEKKLPPAIEKALMEKYNLDKPLSQQYVDYVSGVAKGDFGPSMKYNGRTVNDLIGDGFPVSAELGGLAILLIVILGIPLGVVAALKQGTWVDRTMIFFAIVGVTIPSFVLATLLIYVFGTKLKWLPTSRWVSWKSRIMPTIALGVSSIAYVARLTRSSMLEVINQDYIRTARAKGLSETVVVFKHALKNALIPVVTYLGPLTAAILTGSFIIEKIFAVPGMGRMFVESISNRDYTVIMGVTIFYSLILVLFIFIVDLIYGLIDPRIKINK